MSNMGIVLEPISLQKKRTTYGTLGVFNGNGSVKRSMDRGPTKTSLVQKAISNEGDQV